MSLKDLPKITAIKPVETYAFEMDHTALDRWNDGVQASGSDDATISILDVIGEDFWSGGGVTSKRVAAALRSIGARDVTVNINSPGGDFFEGVAIYNLLRAHPHKVTVRILGLAASAASVIAMAGDDVQIGQAGFLMVHNAAVVGMGNRHDLAEAVDMLAVFDDAMAGLYADRAQVDRSITAGWMDDETWFNGETAIAEGLADGLLPSDVVTEVDRAPDAHSSEPVQAVRRLDGIMAKQGIPRSERRKLIAGVKGGTPGAAPTVTHDADAWIEAALQLTETLKN